MSPFKFLDPYNKEDIGFFFGREKETAQLFNAVHASSLTLLYGASGTGKTSLINCGLANKFYDTDWLPLFIRRGSDINKALDEALNLALAKSEENPQTLAVLKKADYLFLDYFKPIYLIFDQFEELFIFGTKEEAHAFYQTIKDLLNADGLHVKVIISIREEWIAYLNEFEKVLPYLFDNRLRIEKMNEENLFNVVYGTLQHAHVSIGEPVEDTIEAILDNIRDKKEGIELTNLQVYLDRVYREASKTSGTDQVFFTPATVAAVGPMDNVISSFLDEEMANIEKQLTQVRGLGNAKGLPLEILFTLVTDNKTKKTMTIEEIMQNLPKTRIVKQEDIAFCLDEFKRIRIMTETE